MIPWKNLETAEDLSSAIALSNENLVMLFKHSTTCSISQMAKMRLEDAWNPKQPIVPFYLDLKVHRALSNQIAEKFGVHHESPQILIIANGECIHDSSHLDISMDEINEVIEFHNEPNQ